MANIELRPYSKPSMWRKMSMANWTHPVDPQVYGRLELDMTAAIEFAKQETERTGAKVTLTHIAVRAVAMAFKKNPSVNAMIRWKRIYERKNIDIFCQVAIPGEKPDLSGAVIRNADTKDPGTLAVELKERAAAVRENRDEELGKSRKSLDLVPSFISRTVLRIIGFFNYTLNLNLKWMGLPRDPFGSAMVTSIGSLGIPEAYAPLVPMSRTPIVIAVGKVEDKPVVRDGQIVIKPMCVITAVFDHRIMDGLSAGKLATTLKKYFADPAGWEAGASAGQ